AGKNWPIRILTYYFDIRSDTIEDICKDWKIQIPPQEFFALSDRLKRAKDFLERWKPSRDF
ncbi:MAG: hypothetical protein ACTSRH_18010, partial [Promethearchaeota archaeon]